ncbi:MAG: hypothetical protein ACR5LF_12170 [Symbiopectobacterium sp.]
MRSQHLLLHLLPTPLPPVHLHQKLLLRHRRLRWLTLLSLMLLRCLHRRWLCLAAEQATL